MGDRQLDEFDLRRSLSVLRKRFWLLVIVVAAALGTTALASFVLMPDVYAASTTLMVKRVDTPVDYSAVLLDQQLAKTYGQVARSRQVADAVIRELSLPMSFAQWQKTVEVAAVRDTQLLTFTVESASPALAARIANTAARVFMARVAQLMGGENMAVVDPALPPDAPIRPRPSLNLAVAAVMGLLGGLVLVFALERLDSSLNSPEDIQRYLGLPLLAAIPFLRGAAGGPATAASRGGEALESYRMLRANLRFLSVKKPVRSILVTSSLPREGKTMTASNLAITLAAAGERVLLIDADLRRPDLHLAFGLDNRAGLTTLLAGLGSLAALARPTGYDHLEVLVAGPAPPNPAELLGSPRAAELLREAAKRASVVIIDGPPLVPFADASVLAGLADGVILVLQAGKVAYQAAQRAGSLLRRARARVLGVVLSGVRDHGFPGYSRYYSYRGPDRSHRADAGRTRAVTPKEARNVVSLD